MVQAAVKVTKTVEVEVPKLEERIKELRKADKRSITQLCAAVGMTPANWYKIEAGRSMPIETLRKIEEVLGTDFGVEL